jgi:hypothetical protein
MPGFRRDRSLQAQDRTRSMSATASSHAHARSSLQESPAPNSSIARVRSSLQDYNPFSNASSLRPTPSRHVQSSPPAPSHHVHSSSPPIQYPHRSPLVYPALLSRVAEALRSRITLSDIVKDGLTYKNAFDGRQAVDKIAYIIKTTDRNLALLLGRALDAQKYFHAVTYDHRLRDSQSDVYQFRTRVGSPFHSGELSPPPVTSPGSHGTTTPTPDTRTGSPSNEASNESDPGKHQDSTTADHGTDADADAAEDVVCLLPTGVFTLLTDCYSPTCSKDRLCYSITCPRRLEQGKKPQPGVGIKRQLSREFESETVVEPGLLWIHTVPKEIVDSVSDQEKRRQEAINEVIYTERDFVRDMEYLRDVCVLISLTMCMLISAYISFG